MQMQKNIQLNTNINTNIDKKQNQQKIDRNQNSKYFTFQWVQNGWKVIKRTVQNQIKLKKIIERAQKLDFIENVSNQDKLQLQSSYYMKIFFYFNISVYGVWRFIHKQYRNIKNFGIFMFFLGYLSLTIGIFWQDQQFLNKLSTKNDVYKNQIKYIFRKECLEQNINLQRLQRKKQTFQKLNKEFQEFHSIGNNKGKKVSLLY